MCLPEVRRCVCPRCDVVTVPVGTIYGVRTNTNASLYSGHDVSCPYYENRCCIVHFPGRDKLCPYLHQRVKDATP